MADGAVSVGDEGERLAHIRIRNKKTTHEEGSLMNKAMLRVSVAKFAGEVDRLREEAHRLHESGWRWSVPARRGELHEVVAEPLWPGGHEVNIT